MTSVCTPVLAYAGAEPVDVPLDLARSSSSSTLTTRGFCSELGGSKDSARVMLTSMPEVAVDAIPVALL